MHRLPAILLVAASLLMTLAPRAAEAKTLSRAEIAKAMLNRTLITRRFGMKISMVYRPNGTVSAKSLLGSINGTWRYQGNQVCTTFKSGPSPGTSCASFRKTGPSSFVSSAGVSFTAQ